MAIFTGAGVAIITPFHADGSINYEKKNYFMFIIFTCWV